MKIKNNFTTSLFFSILFIGVFLTMQYLFAWTNPTLNPPSDNVSPAINEGSTAQVKDGGLGILGSLLVEGNLGIGVDDPNEKLEVDGNIKANAPIEDNHVATKAYVDAASSGGPGDWECVSVSTFIGSGCGQSSRTHSADCPSGYTLISGACTVGSSGSAWNIFSRLATR